jgi:hypothetical protein
MRNKKPIRKRKATHGKTRVANKRLVSRNWRVLEVVAVEPTGLGPNTAGQSGDIEGLSTTPSGDSESVAELVEEGQDLEAEEVSGVENAPDADEAEVTTHGRQG